MGRMRNGVVSAVFLLTLILLGGLVLVFEVQLVEAGETIYIRGDGSVDPPTAPIQRDPDVYTLTGDINGSIVVERDDVVIDGAGYALQGIGSGRGIDLRDRINVTVKNVEITAFHHGIYLQNSFNNTIINNTLMANKDYAIQFLYSNESSYNSIVGNNVSNNGGGVEISWYSNHNNLSRNCITANNWSGIRLLWGSSHNILSGNNIKGNGWWGVYIDESSSNNTLRNNNLGNNLYNFYVNPSITLEFFMNDIDVSNTVDGKPIYYWINKHDATVPLNAGYVALINCTNITVKNLNLTNNGEGVLTAYTENCTITQNNIANNLYGIFLTKSSNNNKISYNNITDNEDAIEITSSSINNTVCHNNITNSIWLSHVSDSSISFNNVTNGRIDLTASSNNVICYNNITNGGVTLVFSSNNNSIIQNNITNNFEGISLSYSSNHNVISHNNIAANYCGIDFSYSSNNNTISHNNMKNSHVGFDLSRSSYNTVSHNNITNNQYAIILSFWCSSNIFHHNNFVNNTFLADIWRSGANIWDDGYPSGGNYWSSHNPPDEDKDKIGDAPYTIDANNVDRYPLIYPYGFVPNPDLNDDGIVNVIDVATVARAFRCEPGDSLWNPAADMDTNEIINIIDIAIVALRFGETTP